MNRVVVLVLCVLYLLMGSPAFLLSSETPDIIKAVTYHWFHANVFHLSANCLSFWLVYKSTPRRRAKENIRQFVISFLIGTVVFFCSTRPIIGISNILFATIGLRTPSFRSDWWKRPETLVFIATTIILLMVPQISSVTHIISFTIGVSIAVMKRKITRIKNDYRHAAHK